MGLDQLADLVPVTSSGDRQHHVAGAVVVGVVLSHGVGGQSRDAVAGAQDLAAERVSGEVSLHDLFVGGERRLVVVHPDLLQDDLLLHLEVIAAERGVEQCREHFQRGGQVFGQDRGVELGHLLAGRRVVVGPELVEDPVHVIGAVDLVALERHVLKEVAHPRDVLGLVPRSGADKDTRRNALGRRVQLGNHLQPVLESGLMKLHRPTPVCQGPGVRDRS